MAIKINKNFIVDNGKGLAADRDTFFPEEDVTYISEKADMLDVLVIAGIYKTRLEALDKWKKNIFIPDGFTMYRNIESEHHMVCVYNPV